MQEVTLGTIESPYAPYSDQPVGGSTGTGNWLTNEHFGVTGWKWIGIIAAVLGILIAICCCCKLMHPSRSRRQHQAHLADQHRQQQEQDAQGTANQSSAGQPSFKKGFSALTGAGRGSSGRNGASKNGKNGSNSRGVRPGGARNGRNGVGANPFLGGFGQDRHDANIVGARSDNNPYVIEELPT